MNGKIQNRVILESKYSYLPMVRDGMVRVKSYEVFHTALKNLRDMLPSKQIVIAGGAIRDTMFLGLESFKDLDVFVLETDENEAVGIINSLSECVSGAPPEDSFYSKSNPFKLIWSCEYPLFYWNTVISGSQIRVQPEPNEKSKSYPMQIITHKAKTVEELLNDFDWKACQFAFDGNEIWAPGVDDFLMHRLTLCNVRNPFHTLRRGFYLENKYRKGGNALHVQKDDIITLSAMIMLDPEA